MNADTKEQTLVPLNSASVQARIADERRRLLIEQNIEHGLTGQRLAPLEAGDDEALDRVEVQINACRDRQFRIQERLEILEKRLIEANERDAEASLDAIAERANRARAIGEKLIGEQYAKHATALAAVLGKLAAIDILIDETNRILDDAGKPRVLFPNDVRCRKVRRWKETVRKRVGINQVEHPVYGQGFVQAGYSETVSRPGGETMPMYVVVDVQVDRSDDGSHPDPLQEMVVPGIGPASAGQGLVALWDGKDSAVSTDAMAALLADLDGAPETPSKRTTSKQSNA